MKETILKNNTTYRVYKNIRKKCFSVQERVRGRWIVVQHTKHLTLFDCSFYVSQRGRDRVLKEKRKNVHAYIVGRTQKFNEDFPLKGKNYYDLVRPITYDPYKFPFFTTNFYHPARVDSAKLVCFDYPRVNAFYINEKL